MKKYSDITSEVACEDTFERMSLSDPDTLVQILDSDLSPGFLTYAAELAGQNIQDHDKIVPVLIRLLKHESPLVVEGALYGLWHHPCEQVWRACALLKEHRNPSIRTIIATYIKEWIKENKAETYWKEYVEKK